MSQTDAPQPASLAKLKTIVGAVIAGSVLLALTALVLATEPGAWNPRPLGWAIAIGPALLSTVVGMLVWRMPQQPSEAGSSSQLALQQARMAFQSKTLLAAVMSANGGVLAFVYGFVETQGAALIAMVGPALAALGVILTAWPTRSRARRLDAALRAVGQESQVERELFEERPA